MKKILILLFINFIFISQTFWFDKDLSVKNESLVVNMVENISKSQDKYIWEEYFLEKFKNNSKVMNYYNKNLFNLYKHLEPDLSGKLAFIQDANGHFDYKKVFEYDYEITLKNDSLKDFEKKINYSIFELSKLNPYIFENNLYTDEENFLKKLDQILIFPSNKSDVFDLEVFVNWKKIDVKKVLKLKKYNWGDIFYNMKINNVYYFSYDYEFDLNLEKWQESKINIKFKKRPKMKKVFLWEDSNWIFWNNLNFDFLWENYEVRFFLNNKNYVLSEKSTLNWKDFIKSENWFYYFKNFSKGNSVYIIVYDKNYE